jgi:hypothetical protein
MEWSRSSFELHPEGVFKAVFVNWEESKSDRFGTNVKLSLDTEELDSQNKPFRVFAYTKPSLHEKGKVAKMLKAFGVDAEEIEPESFDLDEYLNRKCLVVIEHYKGETGEDRHKITNFLPLKKKGQASAPPAEEAPKAKQGSEDRQLVGAAAGSARPDWGDDD